jgi:hypothetical protein
MMPYSNRSQGGLDGKRHGQPAPTVLNAVLTQKFSAGSMRGGEAVGSIIKKRRKKMRKHKHKKLLAKTRHQRRSK